MALTVSYVGRPVLLHRVLVIPFITRDAFANSSLLLIAFRIILESMLPRLVYYLILFPTTCCIFFFCTPWNSRETFLLRSWTTFVELAKNPIDLVSVGLTDDSNVYDWDILIMGPDGTLYEGGFFKARLVFPPDFPNMPPTMTFQSDMWHPNVYEDGRVCISILHPPGEDAMNSQESADERWRPILGVEQILMSVVSMLNDPNDESPANLDAAVQWRNDRTAFKKKVRKIVRKSQEMC